MKRTDLPERFQALLRDIPYITIATVCPDGTPWNSPVVGTFDFQMNLYWISWKNNQHSRNIDQNPHVFVVVYDSRTPEGQGEGLYLKMTAHAVTTAEDLATAQTIYDTAFFKHPFTHAQFDAECPQRIYRASPEAIWYNIDGKSKGHFVDRRKLLATTGQSA